MKKLIIGFFALAAISQATFANTYTCGDQIVESKAHGHIYIKNERQEASIDVLEQYEDRRDEKTLYVVYRLKIDEEVIQRKAYYNKSLARKNDAAVLNYLDDMFVKITDQIGETKIILNLNILNLELQGKIKFRDGRNETIRLYQKCSQDVLQSLVR